MTLKKNILHVLSICIFTEQLVYLENRLNYNEKPEQASNNIFL